MTMFNLKSPIFSGANAPVRVESEAICLDVDGIVPPELVGSYFRVAADPQFPPRQRPIGVEFDGFVTAFHFRDGGEVDFVGRWVRTERFEAERAARRALFGTYRNRFHDDPIVEGVDRTTANTALLFHHGKFFAVKEDGMPYEMDPETLATIGRYDFNGQVGSRHLCAHPKIDPETGELITFGSQAKGEGSSDIAYYVFDKMGRKTVERWFEAPYSSIVHDAAVTKDWVIIPIMPVTVDLERMRQGGATYWWEPERGTHVAVFRRDGTGEVRWFEIDASYSFHVVNSYQEGDKLIVDLMDAEEFPMWWPRPEQVEEMKRGGKPHEKFNPKLNRWTIDLTRNSNEIERVELHPWEGEMPRIDERFAMQPYRYAVYGVDDPNYPIAHNLAEMGTNHNAIGWWDHQEAKLTTWYTGPEASVGEPVFAPRTPDAPEGDGFIIATVQRLGGKSTEVVVLDTRNIAAGPVATIHAPHRLRNAIHNAWVSQDELAQGAVTR